MAYWLLESQLRYLLRSISTSPSQQRRVLMVGIDKEQGRKAIDTASMGHSCHSILSDQVLSDKHFIILIYSIFIED